MVIGGTGVSDSDNNSGMKLKYNTLNSLCFLQSLDICLLDETADGLFVIFIGPAQLGPGASILIGPEQLGDDIDQVYICYILYFIFYLCLFYINKI